MGHALTAVGSALKAALLRAAQAVETCGAKNRLSHAILPRFSRITSGGVFLPEIDGLRFIAISWVFMLHLYQPGWIYDPEAMTDPNNGSFLGFLCLRGKIGVPLFFIISGFILGMPFARHHLCGSKAVRLPKYFLRRVTRLEPPYIIHLTILLLVFVLAALLGRHGDIPSFSEAKASPLWYALKHDLASLVYSHKMIFFGEDNPLNSVLWSLEVEIQFYLLVPLLALVFAIRTVTVRRLVIVSIIIAFTCFALTPWARMHSWVWQTILTELQWFMTGFLLVDIMLATPAEKLKPKLRWDLISLVGWCALPFCEASPALYGLTVPAAFLAYLGVFRGQVVVAFFRNPWITTIGGMCYTIYMYHYIIMEHFMRHTNPVLHVQDVRVNLLVQTVVIGGITLGVCSLLFLFCERPFMHRDWPQKAWATARRLYQFLIGRKAAPGRS
jgi:peptidoglycan/LPS O-acetylase OafA/YrhL